MARTALPVRHGSSLPRLLTGVTISASLLEGAACLCDRGGVGGKLCVSKGGCHQLTEAPATPLEPQGWACSSLMLMFQRDGSHVPWEDGPATEGPSGPPEDTFQRDEKMLSTARFLMWAGEKNERRQRFPVQLTLGFELHGPT